MNLRHIFVIQYQRSIIVLFCTLLSVQSCQPKLHMAGEEADTSCAPEAQQASTNGVLTAIPTASSFTAFQSLSQASRSSANLTQLSESSENARPTSAEASTSIIDRENQLLAERKKRHGEVPHPDIAMSLSSIGMAYQSLGDGVQALDYLEQALKMHEKLSGGVPNTDVAMSLNNVGEAYERIGEVSQSLPYYEQSLAMRQEIYGEEPHPDVADSLYNVGQANKKLGEIQIQKSLPYYEQSLAMRQKLYGKSHKQPQDISSATVAGLRMVSPTSALCIHFGKLDLLGRTPPEAFDAQSWRDYFGVEVDGEPPLPADIEDILNEEAPFLLEGEECRQRVRDNHLLTLIPGEIDEEVFTLDKLGGLISRYFPDNNKNDEGANAHGYRYYSGFLTRQNRKTPLAARAYWLLLPKTILADSRNKTFSDQTPIVSAYSGSSYRLPYVLEVATSLLSHYARSKERLYVDAPCTFTRCPDRDKDSHPLAVGAFSPTGLSINISLSRIQDDDFGVSCARKL